MSSTEFQSLRVLDEFRQKLDSQRCDTEFLTDETDGGEGRGIFLAIPDL